MSKMLRFPLPVSEKYWPYLSNTKKTSLRNVRKGGQKELPDRRFEDLIVPIILKKKTMWFSFIFPDWHLLASAKSWKFLRRMWSDGADRDSLVKRWTDVLLILRWKLNSIFGSMKTLPKPNSDPLIFKWKLFNFQKTPISKLVKDGWTTFWIVMIQSTNRKIFVLIEYHL